MALIVTSIQNVALNFTVDMVLRGQGADPKIIRSRRPALVALAEKSIRVGQPFINPTILYETFKITKKTEQAHTLNDRWTISGKLITEQLKNAEQVTIALVTIGTQLETELARIGKEGDMALSLALDGLANAAVDQLSICLCNQIEQRAREVGMQTTSALGPGMLGWSVETGQPQIFNALHPDPEIIELLPSGMMNPRKSTSFAIGIGKNISSKERACEYCAMNATCRYYQAGDAL